MLKEFKAFIMKGNVIDLAVAVDVYRFCESIPYNNNSRTITYQLIKAATSVAANWRAFCRARSENEAYAKICIVVEEADETEFWLEFFKEAKVNDSPERSRLQQEAHEIVLIVATIKSKHIAKRPNN